MMFLRAFLLVLCAASVASCASYMKRKECEKTNWHQYGYQVAMSGRRLDADDFVKQCQKVEAKMSFQEMDLGFKSGMAKYCTGDNVFETGKAGKPFAYEMCDGESIKKMRSRHAEGLRVFCTPANGYRFGTGGGVYLNVCPKDFENDWLTEYRKGRKIYLTSQISEKEREADRLDREITQMEYRRRSLSSEKMMYEHQTETVTETVVDPTTGLHRQQRVTRPSSRAQMQASSLSSEISHIDYQMREARRKREELLTELSKMRSEVATL
jgi:hypothetical protein